jgi:hypothetical protein
MSQPMSAVVDKLRQGLAIRTRWPVSNISYDQGGAVLTGPDGVRLGARKVVVTASLAVLQSGRLAFSPPLPADKQGALRRLRMGNAAKVRRGRCLCGVGGLLATLVPAGGHPVGWLITSAVWADLLHHSSPCSCHRCRRGCRALCLLVCMPA